MFSGGCSAPAPAPARRSPVGGVACKAQGARNPSPPARNFKQPTAFSRAHAPRGLRYFPLKRRGGRSAETALVRIAAPRGPPRGRADLRFAGDRRSMTGAPLGVHRGDFCPRATLLVRPLLIAT